MPRVYVVALMALLECSHSEDAKDAKCNLARAELAKGWSDLADRLGTLELEGQDSEKPHPVTLAELMNGSAKPKEPSPAETKALEDTVSSARTAAEAWSGPDDPTSASDAASKSIENTLKEFKDRLKVSEAKEVAIRLAKKEFKMSEEAKEAAIRRATDKKPKDTPLDIDSLAKEARKLHSHGPSITAQCGTFRQL